MLALTIGFGELPHGADNRGMVARTCEIHSVDKSLSGLGVASEDGVVHPADVSFDAVDLAAELGLDFTLPAATHFFHCFHGKIGLGAGALVDDVDELLGSSL